MASPMSRTNVQVLIATALLGVLLVLVLRLTGKLAEKLPEDERLVAPVAGPANRSGDAGEPVPESITSYDEFLTVLDAMGLDGEQLLAETARWYQARGFLGAAPLLGIGSDTAPLVYYESLDDTTLSGLASTGDMAAAQVLASRNALRAPTEAIREYATAAALGSTYALLQLASLYETFATIDMDTLHTRIPDSTGEPASLSIRSLAYLLAALRDGGPALADEPLLAWIDRLEQALSTEQQSEACTLSAKLFLEFSSQRRRQGLPPVRTEPPPAFLTAASLDQRLPCANSPSPYRSTLDLTACTTRPVRTEHGRRALLVVCR